MPDVQYIIMVCHPSSIVQLQGSFDGNIYSIIVMSGQKGVLGIECFADDSGVNNCGRTTQWAKYGAREGRLKRLLLRP